MTREQLEHVIRAAAEITGDPEIVVIGSTSILGQFPNAPPEVHDLVLSKYVASREKDRAFDRAALRHGFVDRELLLERLALTPIDVEARERIARQIEADAAH